MLILFNSLTRRLEAFKPIKKGRVGLYTCGPTVYHYAHIGNLRAYVSSDILKRVLTYNGYKVKHVMNITDVGHLTSDSDTGEDKMEKGAKREGKTAWDIANFYIIAFEKDLADLNIISPTIWCRATDHIKQQIKLIKKLEKKGFTYQTADGIYFDTSKLPDYGKLANLKNQELRAGVRVDIGDKKNITDFALWKFSPKIEQRQMEWKSPWGTGFPGWHIECSAMSTEYLGQPFDIHTGGIDHIPVHHTNEIAQSEAAEGKPLANYWLHNEFLLTGADKMSKSADNFTTLQALKSQNINPLAYRYLLLQTHYRKQLNFSTESLTAAENGLKHLYEEVVRIKNQELRIKNSGVENKFLNAINDDLNIPQALAVVWEAINKNEITYETLLKFDEILGLNLNITTLQHYNITTPPDVQKLLNQRQVARDEKNWSESDRLREEIKTLGWDVEDTSEGQKTTKI